MHFDEAPKRKSLLFLKKKKQKDFHSLSGPGADLERKRMKVFWFSFSKENTLHRSTHEDFLKGS